MQGLPSSACYACHSSGTTWESVLPSIQYGSSSSSVPVAVTPEPNGIAFVLVLLLIVGMFWRVCGRSNKEQQKKDEAAAADVARVQEDDEYFSPDSPAKHEDMW